MTIVYVDTHGKAFHDYVLPLSWLPLFSYWKGSVFQRVFLEFLCIMIGALLVLIIKVYTNVLEPLVYTIQGVYSSTEAVLTFLLGFYALQVFGRWWSVRMAWSELCGCVVNYSLRLQSLVTNEESEEMRLFEQLVLRTTRWMNLAFGLVVQQVFSKPNMVYSSLDSMQAAGLMTEAEKDILVKVKDARPMLDSYVPIPLAWILRSVQEYDLMYGDTMGLRGISYVFQDEVSNVRRKIGVLYSYHNTPMPLSYRQIVNLAVRLYATALVFLCGNLSTLSNGTVTNVTWSNAYDLIFVAINFIVYVGWLDVAEELANPFRYAPDGLDIDKYASAARISSLLCLMSSKKGAYGAGSLEEEMSMEDNWKHVQALARDKHQSWYDRIWKYFGYVEMNDSESKSFGAGHFIPDRGDSRRSRASNWSQTWAPAFPSSRFLSRFSSADSSDSEAPSRGGDDSRYMGRQRRRSSFSKQNRARTVSDGHLRGLADLRSSGPLDRTSSAISSDDDVPSQDLQRTMLQKKLERLEAQRSLVKASIQLDRKMQVFNARSPNAMSPKAMSPKRVGSPVAPLSPSSNIPPEAHAGLARHDSAPMTTLHDESEGAQAAALQPHQLSQGSPQQRTHPPNQDQYNESALSSSYGDLAKGSGYEKISK